MVVVGGGGRFLMSEVPLYLLVSLGGRWEDYNLPPGTIITYVPKTHVA